MRTSYRHLFFDLDGTLWDLRGNSRNALQLLWDKYRPGDGTEELFEAFLRRYWYHNEKVWALYRNGQIEKHVLRLVRFEHSFKDIGIEQAPWLTEFADDFMHICPRQPLLMDGALELLNYLSGRYDLHIITNGFSEVQGLKMEAGRLNGHFNEIINSEDCGIRKPHRGIFEHAMQRTGASAEISLMIGDDWEADILGARDFGMHQAWLVTDESRHNFTPTYTLRSLRDLMQIL